MPPKNESDQELLEKGLAHYSRKEYKEALASFEALANQEYEILKHYHLGLTFVQLGRLEEGLAAYRKITSVPNEVVGVGSEKLMYGLYINMGSLFQVMAKQKDKCLYKDAVACYQNALKIQGDDARVWNNLGNAYLDLDLYDEAIESFLRAIDLEDEYPEAHYCLSMAYEFAGRYTYAIEQLKKALNWRSKNKIYLNRIAALLFGTGNYQDALTYLQQLIAAFPDHPEGLKNIALVLYNLQDYKRAYDYYRRLLKVTPDFKEPEVQGIFDDLIKRNS
jgi:tetratricopeptide (TPR) repeat protein